MRRLWRTTTCWSRISTGTQRTHTKCDQDRLIVSLLLLFYDATRFWTCVCGILQCYKEPEDVQYRQPSLVKSHSTDEKSETFGFEASSVARWFGTRSTTPNNHRNPQCGANIAQTVQYKWKHEIHKAFLNL